MRPPVDDTWVALSDQPLPLDVVAEWATRPDCGAQVMFTGTVRDFAEGRPGVSTLEYEAYAEQADARLAVIAADARRQWPDIGRIALLHRAGVLGVGQAAVVVAVATTHRAEAFAAARFCIDTLKATLPIWKKETWEGGHDWSPAATDVGVGHETVAPAP